MPFRSRLHELTIEYYNSTYELRSNNITYERVTQGWEDIEIPIIENYLNCCDWHADAVRVYKHLNPRRWEIEPVKFDLEEIMPEPKNEDVTHFEMELTKTPQGTKIYIKSSFVEALMKKLAAGQHREVGVAEGWPIHPHYTGLDRGVSLAWRIPNPPMYINGITNNWGNSHYSPLYQGFNPAMLTMVGLKDGLTFMVNEPMSLEAQDVFSDTMASCIKQLMEGFGSTSSKRTVKIVGKPMTPVNTRPR